MIKIPGVIVHDTGSFCRVCNPGLSEAQADSFAELPKKSDLPLEIQKKLDADFGKTPLDNVLECITQYCNDFCKKAPPGGYPMTPEKCPYTSCPLHLYRLGPQTKKSCLQEKEHDPDPRSNATRPCVFWK
jgi:hypothetical protein